MPHWIAWTLLTLLTWGIWAILFGRIGKEITPAHCQVISTLGITPILLALWWIKDTPSSGSRRRGIWLALGSGILSCLGNIACYAALNHGKAATVIPLTALYPVVTVLLAIPILKERLNPWQWIGIGASLAAIYLFNSNTPGEAGEPQVMANGWMLLPFAAIVLWGITGLMQKASTNDISARLSAIWFLAAFFPVAVLILVYDPLPAGISLRTWAYAVAIGFTLALGNLTLLLAFASGGKASIIVPLAGLYPLASIPIAILAFGERLGWRESCGIVLALTAVVMLSFQSEPEDVSGETIETDTSS